MSCLNASAVKNCCMSPSLLSVLTTSARCVTEDCCLCTVDLKCSELVMCV